MSRIALALSSLALAACPPDPYQMILDAPFLTTGSTGAPSPTTGDEPTTGDIDVTTSGTTAATTGTTATTTDTTTSGPDETDTSEEIPPPPPKVEAIDLPASVHAAGWVPVTITTSHATSARLEIDGVEGDALTEVAPGQWSGAIPIRGEIDIGTHTITAAATRDDLEDLVERELLVDAPDAGTVALTVPGPIGSKLGQIALTREGDLLAIGTVTVNGVTRPALSKHSGLTGENLWPAPVLLDARQGSGVDLGITPAGDVWVAMNVKDTVWRARLALLDAAGAPLGVEIEHAGKTVQAIAADSKGGCFATGFEVTAEGDQDVVMLRIDGDHVPTLNTTFDHTPEVEPKPDPHTFDDLGFDVVIDGDVAWIVGSAIGKHFDQGGNTKRARGLVLKRDLHTGKALQPETIAPKDQFFAKSIYYGAAPYAGGLVVVGQGISDAGTSQRIEISLLTGDGARTWFAPDPPADAAFGSAVALDSQGRVIVAGAKRKNNTLHGYVYAQALKQPAIVFSRWFSQGGSEARSVVVEPRVDRIRVGGYVTTGQSTESSLMYIHP